VIWRVPSKTDSDLIHSALLFQTVAVDRTILLPNKRVVTTWMCKPSYLENRSPSSYGCERAFKPLTSTTPRTLLFHTRALQLYIELRNLVIHGSCDGSRPRDTCTIMNLYRNSVRNDLSPRHMSYPDQQAADKPHMSRVDHPPTKKTDRDNT
jgi:hypothetical protein